MKRQLIALSLLTASVLPSVMAQVPANALTNFTIDEQEGRSKNIGTLKDNSQYILRGVFGGNPSDTKDSFSFFVPKRGTYTFVFAPSNPSDKMTNQNMTVNYRLRGSSVKKGSNKQYLELSLAPGSYSIDLSGQSSLSAGTFVKHQVHLITPR
ncbi:hypothetical protein [Acaryochloris sp. CCMEE 5410]|uniref:hypothetical protein n=1 Tax=Acaryochloris sp. CCMEE 5410 TaxID=310037 RepID=UPI0002484A64|nr:hypothetical protein [Acaryochloris sp. CCMEE 5410]KAI9129201.1 hypothetical protein ON05_035925 [Acaryochloris sp. CCMEE 5410]